MTDLIETPPIDSHAVCRVVPRINAEQFPLYQAGQLPSPARRGWLRIDRAIKLSSNERSDPPPRCIRREARRVARSIHRYPPRYPIALIDRLSSLLGVDQSSITVGNGSDELLNLIGQAYFSAGDEALIPQHTFSVYAHVTRTAGAKVINVAMPNDSLSVDAILEGVSSRTKAVFLASPNNPTGDYLTVEQMRYLCEQIPTHVLIVVDHAYADFCLASDFCLAERLISRYPNVVTLRTFSKLYGLAGLRIGYACSHPSISEHLNRIRMPFNVNTMALNAALAALDHRSRLLRYQGQVISERDAMRARLTALGYAVLSSHGNFITIRLDHDSAGLADFFATHHIAVRPLHSFGLPQHLRITVASSRRVNARVLNVLAKYAQLYNLSSMKDTIKHDNMS